MKLGFSHLFGKRKQKTEYDGQRPEGDMRQKTPVRKRLQGTKNKKMLPFFRRVQVWSTIGFIVIFLLSFMGYFSFGTIGASFFQSAGASLPPNVKEVQDEYTAIKNNYGKFDFITFKKLLGQNTRDTEDREDETWAKLSEVFFGNEHLKYMKAAVEKAGNTEISPEEAGIQTPQITVSGISMKNNNEMVVALSFNGRQETWFMHKKGGKWTSDSLPPEYVLIDAKPDAKDEIPYFEIGLRTAPELRWKVQTANTAVKTQGKLTGGTAPEVVSEIDKMRTAGSFIMVKENGKTRYINMAPPAPESNAGAQGTQNKQGQGTYVNGAQNTVQASNIPPELQKIINSIPVQIPVTAPGGSKGVLKTNVDISSTQPQGQQPQQPQGISSVQPVPVPQPSQDAAPAIPAVPSSVPQNN